MGDKIRLLLVEDEQTLAGIIADTLSEKGFEVTVAHDGEAGLRAFRGSRPDVVVSDVMMPCMDGFTFVGRLRREAPGVPVLFLSARSAAEDVVQGFETGGNDYLRKPFAMSELIAGGAGSGDVMSGNMAADALKSYMGYTALGEGAADIPNFSNVEIGGGHITGTETSEEEPAGRAFAMYSTEQYMEPKREYTTVTTVDGAKWYRQYAQDVVEKKPYQNPDGGISYRESLIRRLPDPPRRKDKT